MRIGIDFDNTIVNYDEVFKKVALQLSLIKKDWNGTKQELRKKIIREKNEEVWKKLQGLVYGKYMHLAKISDGFINFSDTVTEAMLDHPKGRPKSKNEHHAAWECSGAKRNDRHAVWKLREEEEESGSSA